MSWERGPGRTAVGPAVETGREWLRAGWRHRLPAARGEAVEVAVRRGLDGAPTAGRPVLLRVVRRAEVGVSAGLWLSAGSAWLTGVQLLQAADYAESPELDDPTVVLPTLRVVYGSGSPPGDRLPAAMGRGKA